MRNFVTVSCLAGLVFALGCGGGEAETQTTNTPTTTTSATAAPVASTASTAVTPPPAKKPLAELIKENMKAFEAAFAAHDAAKCAASYAADATFAAPGPMGWKEDNKDGIQKNFAMMFTAFPDAKLTPVRVFMKGNQGAIEGVLTGTNSGEFMGKPATNKKIGHRYLAIMTFNDDGLIKTEHLYQDHSTMMGHLGHGDAKLKWRNVEAIPTMTLEQVSSDNNPREAKDADAAKAWLGTWEKKDEKGYLAGLAADVTKANYMEPADVKGADKAKHAFEMLHKAFPDIKMTPTNVMAIGDYVITEVEMSGTMKGNLGSVKSTGKPGTAHVAQVLKFNHDGKITWAGRYGSRMEFKHAFGIPPKMPAAAGGHEHGKDKGKDKGKKK
jgi:steroid delta-isomerase-like uncharacterized protein